VSPRLSDQDAVLLSNSLLVGAMEWVVRGFPVFPLAPGDKVPLAGSRGLLDATLDLATVERWWTELPDANIGVRMDGHLAVDVDPDSPEYRDTLRLWFENGWPLPATLTQLTGQHRGRRGFHLIYKAPPGVKFDPHPWPGVDIKVGTTGYIVGAPSRHPSGVNYELVWNPPVAEPPIAEAPSWLVEHAGKHDTTPLSAKNRSRSRGLAGLLDTFPERGEGQRHDALIEAAGFYAKAMPYRDGFIETMRAANELLAEPYRGAELEAELGRMAGVWDQEQAKGRIEFERRVQERRLQLRVNREAQRQEDAEETAETAPPPSPLTLAEELAGAEDEGPLAWTVDSILPEGHNVSLTGEFKTGKTTLADVNLPRALVDSKRFLGVFSTHLAEGRVGIWNYEVTNRQFRLWLREADIQHPERMAVLHLRGHRLDLLSEAGQEWAAEWLAEREVRVWILDPWALVLGDAGLEENDNTGARRLTRALDRIKEQAGVSNMLVTHHTGRKDVERARGATALDDWADTRWLLTQAEGRRSFTTLRSRDVDENEWRLEFDPETRRLEAVGGGRRVVVRETRELAILRAIEDTPGIGSRQLRIAVGGNKDRTDATLSRLVEERLVQTEPGSGNAVHHYLSEPGRVRLAELQGRLPL
jgi:Bifunctional DNA primase/polymerase, N-terminal/AAA domain